MRAEKQDGQLLRFDQSGALLRKVMESAAVGMTLVGADGRMIYANRAYEAMTGYDPDELLGKVTGELVFDEDRQNLALRFAQLMRGEVEELRLECRTKCKDGSAVWGLVSSSLLRSEQTGDPLYAIVQVINIDRQKRAEEALAQSESRWNYALEAAGQGVWDHDIRTDDMFYSRMWRTMRGIPQGEYVDPAQDAWLSRVHPDDVPRILATVQKQDAGEDGYDTLEYRERHRDGHWVWILSRGKPVEWDDTGQPIRTLGTDTDITRLKNAETQLAEEKERLRVTLESIGDGVISTDAEAKIVFMNPIAEQMTGWLEADAIGRPIGEVFVACCADTGTTAPSAVARCLESGLATQIGTDVLLLGDAGHERPIRGTAAAVRTEDGHLIGTVLVFQDTTEARDLHRKLEYSATHDALTDLPNRAAFETALAEVRQQGAAEQRSHALCYIDLDLFKAVNDSAGHAAGDALLKQVALLIRKTCRQHDFAARIGGDEFVVLLADCSKDAAQRVGAKIVAAIADMRFAWEGRVFEIGASIGVAEVLAGSAHDVLAEADAACYRAKGAGRGRVIVSAA